MKTHNKPTTQNHDKANVKVHLPPKITDHLISIAEKRPMVVCTRGKQCSGSLNGKEFMYADGSKDFGVTITVCCAKIGGTVFWWSLENDQAHPTAAKATVDGTENL